MNNDKIKEIALANGFKLKKQPDGTWDLNPYVYDAVNAIVRCELQELMIAMVDGCKSGLYEQTPSSDIAMRLCLAITQDAIEGLTPQNIENKE